MAHTVGGGKLGGDGIAGGTLHDTPTVVVAAITTATSNPLTASWTYTQAQGDSQEYYRVGTPTTLVPLSMMTPGG